MSEGESGKLQPRGDGRCSPPSASAPAPSLPFHNLPSLVQPHTCPCTTSLYPCNLSKLVFPVLSLLLSLTLHTSRPCPFIPLHPLPPLPTHPRFLSAPVIPCTILQSSLSLFLFSSPQPSLYSPASHASPAPPPPPSACLSPPPRSSPNIYVRLVSGGEGYLSRVCLPCTHQSFSAFSS